MVFQQGRIDSDGMVEAYLLYRTVYSLPLDGNFYYFLIVASVVDVGYFFTEH